MVNRAVLAHRLFAGLSRRHLACLVQELAVPWQAGVEVRRHAAWGAVRKRAEGTGARHQLVFVDRLVATLIHLRHDLPHSVLGLLFAGVRTLGLKSPCSRQADPTVACGNYCDVAFELPNGDDLSKLKYRSAVMKFPRDLGHSMVMPRGRVDAAAWSRPG